MLSLDCHLLSNQSTTRWVRLRSHLLAWSLHPHSPHPQNLEPKHLKLLNLACTAPYQGPTANKHYCLGTSQRTKLYSAAGGGGEVGSTCTIKSKGCTCGPTLTTETVDRRFCAPARISEDSRWNALRDTRSFSHLWGIIHFLQHYFTANYGYIRLDFRVISDVLLDFLHR